MIKLAQLQEMFEKIKSEAPFDPEHPLVWGYFFTDPDAAKLEQVARELALEGYRQVDLYPTEDGETLILHVEKVERHSPESLHERNQYLHSLADRFALQSYDGMDVGPPATH